MITTPGYTLEAIEAQRIEDAIHGAQRVELATDCTMLDGLALYLSNLADKRADNPTVENALNLAAAHSIQAAEWMKQGH